LAFMDKLGLPRAALVGNSMGGMVGTRLAADHPDRITRLVTIGGAGVNLYTTFPNEGINLLVEFAEQPTRERLIAWLHSMVYDQSLITETLIEDRWKRATEANTLAVTRKMYSRASIAAIAAANKKSQPWAHLQAIQCPTLITWGRDDRVTPLDWSILPMRLIAKCELHIFYDCGHWAMIERKNEFENVVLAYLQRD
jgi:pimeloyl-ACP methyl ester carboxylesterase